MEQKNQIEPATGMTDHPPIAGKRESLFVIAYKFFPKSFLVKGIGLTFTTSLYIYHYLIDGGIDSILERVLLTALIVGGVPTLSLYLVTLARAPRIRRREEAEAARLHHIAQGDWKALKAKEHEEEQKIIRLEQVASGDKKARRIQHEKDDKRWDVLTESLRLQNETVELASEERLLVAQQVKEIKEEGEVIRKGLASEDLEARKVKDQKEDERWEILNEKLRAQKAAGQQTEDLKEEREEARKQLASVDLKAQKVKDLKETERWDNLNERLRARDETADGRSSVILHSKELKEEQDTRRRKDIAVGEAKMQQDRDFKEDARWDALDERLRRQEERAERLYEEFLRMRREDQFRNQYAALYKRFQRQSALEGTSSEIEDGIAPIPEEWFIQQPEIKKMQALLDELRPFNNR